MNKTLREEQIRKVKELLGRGVNQRKISKLTGVSQGHVSAINRNNVKIWKNT